MASGSFAVVICHGSYHTPAPYQPFIRALKAKGIDAYCPQLPTSDLTKLNIGDPANPDYDRPPPIGGYPQPVDDSVVLNELLEQLIDKEGRDVVLIGHSSGGFVATNIAVPRLQKKVRTEKGGSGGILGIFYVCAFLVPMGHSVHTFFQPKDGSPAIVPPYCQFHRNGFDGLASTVEGSKYFFNGLDKTSAQRYEATLTASPVLTTVLNNDAYADLPCAYLITECDLALPPSYQEWMVGLHNARPEVNITVYRCNAGHSPHLTLTDGLVQYIEEFEKLSAKCYV